jgi:hypothetical protein
LRLAKANLAIRSIDPQIGYGDTLHNDECASSEVTAVEIVT